VEAARTTAASFISCQLDYCSSLLYGLPDTLLHKLQSVQNANTRLISGTRRSDHISPVLRKLHWLPIREHVKFSVACLVRQSLSRQVLLYLADDCRLALCALCGQLMFRLAWCRKHSVVMATELLQLWDLTCGTLFQPRTSPIDCSNDSWRDTFFGKHEHSALWLLICGAIEKHLLTYLH